jgi:hypothetical protein
VHFCAIAIVEFRLLSYLHCYIHTYCPYCANCFNVYIHAPHVLHVHCAGGVLGPLGRWELAPQRGNPYSLPRGTTDSDSTSIIPTSVFPSCCNTLCTRKEVGFSTPTFSQKCFFLFEIISSQQHACNFIYCYPNTAIILGGVSFGTLAVRVGCPERWLHFRRTRGRALQAAIDAPREKVTNTQRSVRKKVWGISLACFL